MGTKKSIDIVIHDKKLKRQLNRNYEKIESVKCIAI